MNPKIKILMVEDELSILTPYVDFLTMRGYEVQKAADGDSGLSLAKSFKPDIILLDIMLPKVDGLDVLRQLKADAETAKIKVILLTALGRDSVIKQGFDLGADAYLIKDQEDQESVEKAILKTLGK